MDWLNNRVPLTPERDDEDAPDWPLDHAHWGGFASHFGGCAVASEEAIRDMELATGVTFDDANLLSDVEFDEALIEGEAWRDDDAR